MAWFHDNVITKVPFPNPGFMRDVYPGFLQLHGFMSMNLERHLEAHRNLFTHLVQGDGDSAQKHREFYDEYLAVMDLCAEYYLQTVDTVFVRHALPQGTMTHRGVRIDPAKIRRVGLMTVEGENDDISGLGQTEAAHRLCVNIPADRKAHWMQQNVGHYGVFNGSRFRAEIAAHRRLHIVQQRECRSWCQAPGASECQRSGKGQRCHAPGDRVASPREPRQSVPFCIKNADNGRLGGLSRPSRTKRFRHFRQPIEFT